MKILANDGISSTGINLLQKNGFEVLTTTIPQENLGQFIQENQVDILLVRSATKVGKDVIDAAYPQLKMIGRGGVGLDNIDVAYAQAKNIEVINTPAASSKSVAEMVFAHLFAITRFLHDSNRLMPLEGDVNFNKLKKSYKNAIELSGKTMGIIGFGRIGVETAKIAIALGMKVLVFDTLIPSKTIALQFFDGKQVTFEINTVPLQEVLEQADFISLHVPKQKEYLIGKEAFDRMKNGVVLVNASRGGVIDEAALLEAIESGKVMGAGLDVFETEPAPSLSILMNDALSLSPHVAGNTLEAQDRIGEELAQQIIAKYAS